MRKVFKRNLVNSVLSIVLTFVFVAQKNCFIETVLLSAHNICLCLNY